MAKTPSPENAQSFNSINFIPSSSVNESDNILFTASAQSEIPLVKWWRKKSVRWKTMVLAIAIGTLPTVALGLVAYWTANNSITQQITSVRKVLAVDLQERVNLFMEERLKDIQVMSELDILTNPQLQSIVSAQDKAAALENLQTTYGIYNSIAIFDLQGDVIAQTGTKPLGNHLDRGYIQAALETDKAILSQPRISTSSGIYSVYAAAPIKNQVTGQTIAVIRARMPVAVLEELLQDFLVEGDRYYLLDSSGTIFLGSAGEYAIDTLSNDEAATQTPVNQYEAVKVQQIFPQITNLLSSEVPTTTQLATAEDNQEPQFLTFAPAKLGDIDWQVLIATDSSKVFAPQRNLKQTYILGTIAIAVLMAVVAYYLTKLVTRPILSTAKTVEEIGKGNLKARTTIKGEDEVAQLAHNVNSMAVQLEKFVQEQHDLAQQTNILKQTVIALGATLEEESLWQIAVDQIKKGLGSNGVVYCPVVGDRLNTVVAESIDSNLVSCLGKQLLEFSFVANYLSQQAADTFAIENISQATLTPSQINLWQNVSIANVAIAKVKQQEQPVGLLIAYQSSNHRSWEQSQLDFLEQIANQVSFALDRLDLIQQQKDAQIREKTAKETIQERAFELLQQVDSISQGDLTIRAKVTEDEIGTIADSYNATIYSLQKLVTQVKTAANEVESTAGTNQAVIEHLVTSTVEQAQSMALTMQQIQRMTKSISEVSDSASQAKQIVNQANETIVASDLTMNQAVAQIKALQNTVNETEQKVKLLNESSQEISQVVNSISRFAAQTHLLALKASIEAARAGEQGKGFATIADEVRSLASQSATATTDIENIVARIQLETNEVFTAMTQGTKQVSMGTDLVKQTCHSLNQVTAASQEINQLITAIAESAQGQSAISHQVSENIANVAVSAQTNSQSATQVALQIEQLLTVANKLQADIDQFKT